MHARFLLLMPRPLMFPCWQACNLSSFSLLPHCLHVSLPKGPLTPCHNSSPSNLHQGTVFTRASEVDHLIEHLFNHLTLCTHGAHALRVECGISP